MTDKERSEIVSDWAKNIRYSEARPFARRLRRQGVPHTAIVEEVRQAWDNETADYIDTLKDNLYYMSEVNGDLLESTASPD